MCAECLCGESVALSILCNHHKSFCLHNFLPSCLRLLNLSHSFLSLKFSTKFQPFRPGPGLFFDKSLRMTLHILLFLVGKLCAKCSRHDEWHHRLSDTSQIKRSTGELTTLGSISGALSQVCPSSRS